VGVLEEGDGDKEGVGDEEGEEVEAEDEVPAIEMAEVVEEGPPGEEAEVGEEDLAILLGGEDRGGGKEVAGKGGSGVPAGVHEEVEGPAKEQHKHKLDEGEEGVVGEVLVEGGGGGSLALALGHKDLIPLQVVGEVVVGGMGVLPGEVGHTKAGVQHKPYCVVNGVAGGEGAMAALVGDHPHSGHHYSLHPGVGEPGEGPEEGREVPKGLV